MKIKYIYVACILLVVVFGCAKPPIAEMESAREAVLRAENNADAVQYAGNTLARAQNSLKQMQVEADSKRYDAAKNHAAEAITAAEKAIADGKAGASRARDEAQALVSGLKPAIEETDRGLRAARTAQLVLDYSELNQELTDARDNTDQAETALAMEQYQDALEKGRNARAALGYINQQLTTAVTGVSNKK